MLNRSLEILLLTYKLKTGAYITMCIVMSLQLHIVRYITGGRIQWRF